MVSMAINIASPEGLLWLFAVACVAAAGFGFGSLLVQRLWSAWLKFVLRRTARRTPLSGAQVQARVEAWAEGGNADPIPSKGRGDG